MKNRKFLPLKLKIKSKKNIPVFLLITYFLVILGIYLRQAPVTANRLITSVIVLLLLVTVSAISMLDNQKIKEMMKKQAKWYNGCVLVLSPAVSFLIVEIMVSNFNLTMFQDYSLYNLIWYIIIYYLIFSILRDARLTVILGNLLIYLAAMLNYLVFLFRGNPILPSDLLAWRTGMSVASNYPVSFTQGFLIATLIMTTLFLLGYRLEKTGRRPSLINRLAVLCTFAVFAAVVFNWFFDTNLIKSKIRVIDFFAPKYTYSSYGTAFGFVANVKAMETDSPDGYTTEKVVQAFDQIPAAADTEKTDEKPNMIVIMNEAFSDLSMIGDYPTNIDYLPNIRALKDNTIKGRMFTSVFGGGTSDTEYEFLTGNSMAVMPQNCVPYQQFVTKPTDSLAQTLKDQGYYDIAIHPYKPSGYKRDLVYPLLGFDEFLSMESFKNPRLIRSYISDSDSYKKIIEEYETNESKGPLFIFNVTMQDHGGYSDARLFPDSETVTLNDYQGYNTVSQYLSLLRESDKAFQTLIDYFKNQKEHTIILMFGDHQPIAFSTFHDQLEKTQVDDLRLKYQVPFILWANYDIPEDYVDKISANYLSSYLLKTAGLKGTQYNEYLMDLYQKIPVINGLYYIDKEDRLHSFGDVSPYSDLVKQYKYVGYNDALDRKNKLEQYFYLKQ